jgi:sporulation protein YlmC with PRC-barrel domain
MLRNFADFKGFALAASDGEIGTVREIYFDDKTWRVRYLVVRAGAWISGRDVLIAPQALLEIDEQGGVIRVDLTKEQVRNSPLIDSEKPVSRQYEQDYYDYYGWVPYWLDAGNIPGVMITPTILPPVALPVPVPEAKAGKHWDPHLRSGEEVSEYAIRAQDGEIGHVEDFVIDTEVWRIRYLVVVTRNWFPGKRVLLSPDWIEEISVENHEILVSAARSTIETAPDYDSTVPISRSFEQKLHDHYGHRAYWDAVAELHRK